VDDFSVNIGQAEIATLMSERKSFVIDAQTVQYGRVEVMNMQWFVDHVVTEIVGLSINNPGFHATTGHPF
jgi:hypothetical protein